MLEGTVSGQGERTAQGLEAKRILPPHASHSRYILKRSSLHDHLLTLLVSLLALALYTRTLAPGLLGGDSGEFQFAAWIGGLAHPTGYPLYLMLGYAWSHLLSWGDPAWRMNLFSAFCAALTTGLVYQLALRALRYAGPAHQPQNVYRLLALLAAATFATGATFWSQAVIAEVYALQAALVTGIFLALVCWGERAERGVRGLGPLYAVALLLGLGLAHHRSIILLIPAILAFLALTAPQGPERRAYLVGLMRALPLVVLPVLLYLYIPLRAPYTPYQRIDLGPGQVLELYQPTWAGFWQYVTGQVFEAAFRTPLGALAQLLPAARMLVDEMTWPGIALGVAGLVWLARRRCRPLLILTGGSFAAIVVFNLFYGIGDIYVYFIPAYLIWSLWLAFGVAAVGTFLSRTLRRQQGVPLPVLLRLPARPLLLHLAVALAMLVPAWLLLTNYARSDQRGRPDVRAGWAGLLRESIPQQAILISNDRDEIMPLWYLQFVDGVRPDLTGLFPLIVPSPEWADVGDVAGQALNSGRPVYLIKPMPGLDVKLNLQPEGALVRVIGPAVTHLPERQRDFVFGEAIRLSGYDVAPAFLTGGITTTVTLYWQPQREIDGDYTTFVHLVNGDGTIVGQDDHRAGGVYYPTGLWRPGETLRDPHVLRLAADLGRPPYSILAGLYRRSPGLQHLGQPQTVGHLGGQRPSDTLPLEPAGRADYSFGDQLALLGYDWNANGRALDLKLYWRALRSPLHDYTFFVHLLDGNGKLVAQHDGQPLDGTLPTTAWPARYLVADPVTIPLPDLPQPGTYRLVVGAYDSINHAPLAAVDDTGREWPAGAPLGEVAWPAAQ